MKTAILFFNGELRGSKKFYQDFIVKVEADIFCADGGANLCKEMELIPKEIWGDLDSITEENLNYFKDNKVGIKKFPREKDFTDSELILNHLEDSGYKKIYCIAALGGAIDHELTNINLIFKYKNLIFLTEEEILFKINENKNKRKSLIFENRRDTKISFIIFSKKIENLNLRGFKYNVKNQSYERGKFSLMSNIIEEDIAMISFDCGEIVCVMKNN